VLTFHNVTFVYLHILNREVGLTFHIVFALSAAKSSLNREWLK